MNRNPSVPGDDTVACRTVYEEDNIEVVTLFLGTDPAWLALRDRYPQLAPRPYETLVLCPSAGHALSDRSWRSTSREEAEAIHEQVALMARSWSRFGPGSLPHVSG